MIANRHIGQPTNENATNRHKKEEEKKKGGRRKRKKKSHTVRECVIAHVVARCIRIDEEQDGDIRRPVGRAGFCGRLCELHRNGPRDVAEQQADGADEVHDAAAHAKHEQRDGDAADHAPARDAHVDLLHLGAVREADHLEQVAEVVRDERVAGPLREEAEHHGDEEAAAHARGAEEIEPATQARPGGGRGGGDLALDLEGGVDLCELGLDELGVWVAFCVVLGQDRVGFLEAVVGGEPPG